MPFTLSPATPSDAPSIATIFQETDPSELNTLQLAQTSSLTQRIATNISNPSQLWIFAKDTSTQQIVAYAQWVPPDESTTLPLSDEDLDREREEYRKLLPEGMNIALVLEFRDRIMKLRRDVIAGRRRYILANLGTTTTHRRQGIATALIKYIFPRADEEETIVYLDTDASGKAKGLYETLGFTYVDKIELDLREYGGTTTHTHIGMVREPQ